MSEESATELQREWRAIVLTKLNSLELGQSQLTSEVSGLKSSLAEQQARETIRATQHAAYISELSALKTKVENLESYKSKSVGVILTIQFAMGLILYWLHITSQAIH